jgi:hypothetical protein
VGLFDKVKNAKQQAQDALAQAQGAMTKMGGGGQGTPGAAGAPPGAPAGFQMPNMDEALKYRELAQKLSASGVEAPAVINAIRRGETEMGGGIKAEVDVTIKPADKAAYDAMIKQSILPAWLDTLSAGSTVSVKYDPDSPTSALMYGDL